MVKERGFIPSKNPLSILVVNTWDTNRSLEGCMNVWKWTVMTPVQALRWMIPGGLASLTLFGLLAFNTHPLMILVVTIVGLLLSLVVFVWGTTKFRSYYEIQRTRSDYWTMLYATLIQIAAVAVSAFLYVQLLGAAERMNA